MCGAASYARTYLRCTVQGKTALIRAVEGSDKEKVKRLISAKANVNAKVRVCLLLIYVLVCMYVCVYVLYVCIHVYICMYVYVCTCKIYSK